MSTCTRGVGLSCLSQADRRLSWYLNGPVNDLLNAERLYTQTADPAILFLQKTNNIN